ncbi:hypothetical protein ACG74X_19445 [Marivita sp. S0852]|uniref:hypothetical protein n=1 Tax=Marivita sp. S0852 TaxID=3373893 RepID=UPI003981AAFF
MDFALLRTAAALVAADKAGTFKSMIFMGVFHRIQHLGQFRPLKFFSAIQYVGLSNVTEIGISQMTEPADTNLAERLRQRAEDASGQPEMSLLQTIIAERHVILELRDENHPARLIHAWLDEEGIHIAEGTLRNYIPRIIAALKEAHRRGLESPSDEDILKICRDIERHKASPIRPVVAAPLPTARPVPHAFLGITATPMPTAAHHPSPTLRSDKDL